MGLRRLRGRLDQLQGNANFTMAEAQALIEDVQDGIGIKLKLDKKFLDELETLLKDTPLLKMLDPKGVLLEKVLEFAQDIPFTLVVDPKVDA